MGLYTGSASYVRYKVEGELQWQPEGDRVGCD